MPWFMANPLRSSFFRKATSLTGPVGLLFAVLIPAAACTVTSTVTSGTCAADSAVSCVMGTGYSCGSGASPSAPNCSAGVSDANGNVHYCCVESAACSEDSSIPCTTGTGFNCTGNATLGSTLTCSSGVPQSDGSMDYCCAAATTTTPTCAQSSTIPCNSGLAYACTGGMTPPSTVTCGTGVAEPDGTTGFCCTTGTVAPACSASTAINCASGGSGYDCTGGMTPGSSTLNCGAGTMQADGSMGFCCNAVTSTTPACNASTAVSCASGGMGYDCTGGMMPDATMLSCGAGTPQADGSTGYCCNPAMVTTSTCMANSGVSCLTMGEAGYSCTGMDTPYQATRNLICETVGMTGGTSYCCLPSANSCVQAPMITDCPAGAIGVSCTGTDMPAAMGNSSALLCSPDPGGTAGGYCCGTN